MRKKEATILILSALAISGCSPAFKMDSPAGTGYSASVLRESLGQAKQGSSKALIYVADSTGPGKGCCPVHQELEFAVDAKGNVGPARRIAGPATRLFNPQFQGMDAAGYLYMVNTPIAGGTRPNINVYAPGASGDASPVRTLTMDQGSFSYPFQIAFDAQGYLYEADQAHPRIPIYAPGAQGHVRPVKTIQGPKTGLTLPFGIALDQHGNIFVGCPIQSKVGSAKILVFPAGSDGDVAPSRTIKGTSTSLYIPSQMAVSSSGEIYVSDDTNTGGRILVFAPGANGNVAPVRRISEQNNIFSNGVALFDDELFVAETDNISVERISVFPAHFTGNPPPLRMIEGANTDMHYPTSPIVR